MMQQRRWGLLLLLGLLVPLLGQAQTVPVNSSLTIQGQLNLSAPLMHCDASTGPGAGTDSYSCNLAPAITAYANDLCYSFTADVANTGTASINYNTVGPITITRVQGGITTVLEDNDIRVGHIVHVCYDGAQMQCHNCDGNYVARGDASGAATAVAQDALSLATLSDAATVATLTGAQKLESKRIKARVAVDDTATDVTPDISSAQEYVYTNLTDNLTINPPVGVPDDGDVLKFVFDSGATPRTLSFSTAANGFSTEYGFELPTTTVANKTLVVSARWNAETAKWGIQGKSIETGLTGLLTGTSTGLSTVTDTTVGRVLRVTGSNTFAFGAVDLADTDAITGTLAAAQFPALTGAVTTSAGNLTTALATKYLTEVKGAVIDAPVTGDTNKVQWYFPTAVTITRVACSISGTTSITIQLDERAEATPNTAGVDVMTSALVCDADSASSTTFTNATIAARVPLNLQLTAASGTPTSLRVHVEYTID